MSFESSSNTVIDLIHLMLERAGSIHGLEIVKESAEMENGKWTSNMILLLSPLPIMLPYI